MPAAKSTKPRSDGVWLAQPYARRPLHDACNGFGAVVGVLGVRLEKVLAVTEAPTVGRKRIKMS